MDEMRGGGMRIRAWVSASNSGNILRERLLRLCSASDGCCGEIVPSV